MTNVVAVSGSLRMEKGDTALILDPFLEGMKDAGASVDMFYLKRFKIKPCIGDFHCWYSVPGQCSVEDDMQILYPRLRKADVFVLATPVYIPLPGEMQNFVNRLCPLLEPLLVRRGGRTRARPQDNVRIKKIVLVSTCGWWEKGNFGTVTRIAEELAEDMSIEFAGAVLRPHVQYLAREKQKAEDVLKATRCAGYELVKNGKLRRGLLDTISQPLISEKEFRRRNNENYRRAKAQS